MIRFYLLACATFLHITGINKSSYNQKQKIEQTDTAECCILYGKIPGSVGPALSDIHIMYN